MSLIKSGSARKPVQAPSLNNDGYEEVQFGDVLTLSEVAACLRVREEDIKDMMKTQGLIGRLIGTDWRFLKSALQGWLGGEPKKSSKQALLDLAG